MRNFSGPTLTNRQRSFIIGTLLGGSSLVLPAKGKNCYLAMRDKNVEWIRYKATELYVIGSTSSFLYENNTCRWRSCCYSVLNEFQSMFYHDFKRQINKECLDLLNELAIAIWIGDAGGIDKGQVILNTKLWNQDALIQEYFHEIGLETKVGKNRLIFTHASSVELMKMCCKYYPDWLLRALPSVG